MSLYASWVPGSVAFPENLGGGGLGSSDGPLRNFDGGPLGSLPEHDYQDVVGWRPSGSAHFRGKQGRSVWFHFPVPTPVMVNGAQSSIAAVFVLWGAERGARLMSVHVHDGPIAPFPVAESLNLAGDFSAAAPSPNLVPNANTWRFDPIPVYYGINIAVNIAFDENSDDSQVWFTAAGADFHAG